MNNKRKTKNGTDIWQFPNKNSKANFAKTNLKILRMHPDEISPQNELERKELNTDKADPTVSKRKT